MMTLLSLRSISNSLQIRWFQIINPSVDELLIVYRLMLEEI